MLLKLIPTRVHGVLDFLTAGTMLALPRALGWSQNTTRLLTGAAVGTIGYSLMTRYEMGLVKRLPMKAHLGLDAACGAALCASPWLLPDEPTEVKQTLVGLGLFELASALTTKTESSEEIAESIHLDEPATIQGWPMPSPVGV